METPAALKATIAASRALARLDGAYLTRMLFSHPYLRIDNVMEADLAKRQTAARWLTDLSESGLIIKERVGGARGSLGTHRVLPSCQTGTTH